MVRSGTHVGHTSEIGTFRITSTRYQDGIQRIVFKLNDSLYPTKFSSLPKLSYFRSSLVFTQ
ncbi:MAG: hypothetical protein HDS38_00310 [Bacteroides sp.]|nr:hypothetical protein [Bacteroides sp.]